MKDDCGENRNRSCGGLRERWGLNYPSLAASFENDTSRVIVRDVTMLLFPAQHKSPRFLV